MEYDYSLIEITKTETGLCHVDATFFIETYWEGTELPPVEDPKVLTLLAEPYTDELVLRLQEVYGEALVALRHPSAELPAEGGVLPAAEAELLEDVEVEDAQPDMPALDAKKVLEQPPLVLADRATGIEGTLFALHSVVRGRANRTTRARAPSHHRFTQRVTPDQLRLVRGRPVVLSGAKVLASLEELRAKEAVGILEVRTYHGQCLLNLTTLEAATPPAMTPLVHRLPDSAARDQNGGEFIAPFEGAVPVPAVSSQTASANAAIPPTIGTQRATVPGLAEGSKKEKEKKEKVRGAR